MLTTRKDVAMPYMEGDSRVGCIEHEQLSTVLREVWSALLNAVCLCPSPSSPRPAFSLRSSSLSTLDFALLPSLVPFSTYCSVSEHFVLRAQLVFLRPPGPAVLCSLLNPIRTLLLRLIFLC